jgi:prepilin-type N-terminal cleavage/methylation domain-containing protein
MAHRRPNGPSTCTDVSRDALAANRRSQNQPRDEVGFTLVELLVTIVIIPLVMGAIAFGLITTFSLQNSVSGRLADSGNVQVVSSTFLKDVQSAGLITEQQSPQCKSASGATQTQLLGLAWRGRGNAIGGYLTYVSYVTEQDGAYTSLVRQYCDAGSSTASSTTTVVTDLNTTLTKVPTITCATTGCSRLNPLLNWISMKGVSKVTFKIYETLGTVTGSASTPFQFTLSAAPRISAQTASVASTSTTPFAPLTLLDSSPCTSPVTPVLTTGTSANSTISINVSGGTGNGSIGVASTCAGSVNLGNNTTLAASQVLTADPALNSVTGGKNGVVPPEVLNTGVIDTFTSGSSPLQAPTKPSSATVVSCGPLDAQGVSTCPPGYYSSDPGSSTASTLVFTGGTYYFSVGLNLSKITADFSQGIYIFSSPTVALSLGDGTINGDPAGTLFYIDSGAVNFTNNFLINGLTGLGAYQGFNYDGIAIWDAAAGGTESSPTAPLYFSSNSTTTFSGGGFYVPNGGIVALNNVGITTTFIVAKWANLSNNDGVIIQP